MVNPVDRNHRNADLILGWLFVGLMLLMLATYIIICHTFGEQIQQVMPEAQRLQLRTLLYAVAIIIFPLTNLTRHVQMRLNQTMPCTEADYPRVAKSRYLTTVIVSLSLIEMVGIFGLIMFIVGDGFNTLYIFSGLSTLGLFLYRPKIEEYIGIIEALAAQHE